MYLKRCFHYNDSPSKIQIVRAVDGYGRRHYSPKGVKDHSLHIFGRQHNLLLSAAWNSQGVAHTHTLRRKSGRRKAVEGRTRVIGFFGLPHTAFFCACMAAYRSRRCYLYRFFPNAFRPVILDMLIEAYLCNLELRVLLLQVYTKSSIVQSDIPWI